MTTFLERLTTEAVLAIGRKLAHKRLDQGTEYDRNVAPTTRTSLDGANLVSSLVKPEVRARRGPRMLGAPGHQEAVHAPVLDLDFPAHLVPSSTPGHFHLFLDKELPWPVYEKLLRALAEAGIIEQGYAEASIKHQASYVRLPGIKREVPRSAEGPEDPAASSY